MGPDGARACGPSSFAATCNPFGAGKWEDSFSIHLKGKKVIILPDNDVPGRNHAEQVAASVYMVAELVRIMHFVPDCKFAVCSED